MAAKPFHFHHRVDTNNPCMADEPSLLNYGLHRTTAQLLSYFILAKKIFAQLWEVGHTNLELLRLIPPASIVLQTFLQLVTLCNPLQTQI